MNLRLVLILLGLILILIGLFLPFFSKIPFGRLPGDIIIDKPNFKFYIPITSMLILSIILSLILYLINLFRK
ncbi:MAG: DUF2905 domain-containing protein [Ignavibacteria bacterium]|nr:DUF2905 domain-containing protein [Ignavibacteria bacterium]